MFTPSRPRHAQATLPTAHRGRKLGAAITAVAFGCSALALTPVAAQAAPADTTVTGSYAEGNFLSGVVAGVNLDKLVALQSAVARNAGDTDVRTSADPLSVKVLDAIALGSPTGVNLDLGDIVDAGALHQYAEARKTGASLGASGAVGNDGAISVKGQGGDLTLNLDRLINAHFASVISRLNLQVDAIAAQAKGDTQSVAGKYTLEGLKLNFTSPALANVGSKVGSSLDQVTSTVDGLGGPNGQLTKSLNGLLVNLNPVLGALGSSATVNASVTTDLKSVVQPLLTTKAVTPGVTLDLTTGSVSVDLDKLLGGLNGLPANTEVLSDSVVNLILNSITKQLASLVDQITARVNTALQNARVDVDANVKALSAVGGSPAVPGIPAIPAVPGLPAVLCSVLDLLHLCTPQAATPGTPAVPAVPGIPAILGKTLESDAAVHVHGTVAQVLSGSNSIATASASLLGGTVNANLTVGSVLGSLGNTLTDSLFDGNGAVSALTTSLDTGIVNPAVTALTGPTNYSAQGLLAGLLSVKLNVKETSLQGSGGMAVPSGSLFTETAMRVSVLKDLGSGSLATLNLAQASVGPRVTIVTGPPTVDDPGNPGTPTTGDNPGNPSTPTASTSSRLAFTGVEIGIILAVILALLAAGAYLVREGYRRRHLG
jgi:hypothetical protein